MRGFSKLPLGCLTVLLITLVVWITVLIFVPVAERHVERHGHTLKNYTDLLFHGH